jgi:hypothetical protein
VTATLSFTLPVSFSLRFFFPIALISNCAGTRADRLARQGQPGGGGPDAVARGGELTGVGNVDRDGRRALLLIDRDSAKGERVRRLDLDGEDLVGAREKMDHVALGPLLMN